MGETTDSGTEGLVKAGLSVVEAARVRNVMLRLCGGVAIWLRCRASRGLYTVRDERPEDVDFVGRYRDKARILALLGELGCMEDPRLAGIPGIRRTVFRRMNGEWRGDVFYDRLEFCHIIDLSRRLSVDDPTIPLADLVLQKLQIVEITRKDLLDLEVLLREYDVSDHDDGAINGEYVADLCARDWGLWRTVQGNLALLERALLERRGQTGGDGAPSMERVVHLRKAIAGHRKSFRWWVRASIGERRRWYRVAEEF